MAENMPSGLLEACIVVGAASDKLKEVCQAEYLEKDVPLPALDAKVLQVHAPPFVVKDNVDDHHGLGSFTPVQRRRSFLMKRTEGPLISAGINVDGGVTEDISVPKDIDLVALPQLCFPGGLQVASEQRDDCFHFLLFTNVFGNQSHGVVVQYYRPLQIHQEGFQQNGSTKPRRLYCAYGICVISKHPYYNALRDCLTCLMSQLKTCRMTDFEERVKEFSAKLALVPIPPPGPLHVAFNLSPLKIVLSSREDKDHPLVDLDLHLPFLCFSSWALLQIITGILTEQRLVLFSSDWARLTLVAECLMLYIHPLRWQHPVVPILSNQMLDFVMAPTPFLMGCHRSHYEEVATEADDLILINIDDGTVSTPWSEDVDLPDIPYAAGECFNQWREGLRIHYDLEVLHHGTCTDINALRAHKQQWQQNLNWEIRRITLELIVNIFKDVNNHLNHEHRVFNTDEFLKSRESCDRPFYKKVLETQIFHSFLRDRLNRKMDAFTRMELASEDQTMKADNPRRPTMQEMTNKHSCMENHLNRRLGSSLPNLWAKHPIRLSRQISLNKALEMSLKITPKPVWTFKLPDFPPPLAYQHVHHYYGELLTLLGKAMTSVPPENSALLARYYYLRGYLNTLYGKRLNALSDFQNLYKTDIEIFPEKLVKTLVSSLQSEERLQVERRPELKRLISKVESDKGLHLGVPDDHVKKFVLPRNPMRLEDFVKCTQESGIVTDVATIHRLFDALTHDQAKEVGPELFRLFHTFWKETEAEAQDVYLPAGVIKHLDKNECVYKLSSSVKTSLGVGKIAMTQKRLFLLTAGQPDFVEVTKFRDVEEVKISLAPFLLLRIPSLKIKSALKKEVFEANLKSECDLWNLMVKEMWAGRKMADDHKDLQYVQQALTNVLLMDAVAGCLQSPRAMLAASKLSHYHRIRHKVPMIVPKMTAETLKHKVNLSQAMPGPQAVTLLLYIPGQLSISDLDANPTLWCALSQGRLVVFDAASWTVLQSCIQVGASQLNCMLRLDQEQLWIGSQDSVIYIIDTRSMSCHKQLTEHRNAVMDFAQEEKSNQFNQTEVFSCSTEGTVIVWDALSLNVKRQFNVTCDRLSSIQLYNGTLWCGGRDCVTELRKNGVPRRKISLPQDLRMSGRVFHTFIPLVESGQIWACFADSPLLGMWHDKDMTKPLDMIQLPQCTAVKCMIKVKKQIWVGCEGPGPGLRGQILVVDVDSRSVLKVLMAHTDAVQALCSAENRYVLSGSAGQDGKIAIWKVE